VQETKRAIRRGLGLDPVAAARAESHAQAASLAMDDAREGIAALLAKRAPRFTGR
jgi:enoyl-CoA hydratase/carnithine racemase